MVPYSCQIVFACRMERLHGKLTGNGSAGVTSHAVSDHPQGQIIVDGVRVLIFPSNESLMGLSAS